MRAERSLKRIRGAISLALFWSVAWLAIGAVLGVALPFEGNTASLRMTMASMEVWGIWGILSGLVYAFCLALEPVRSFRQISNGRALIFGALSGLVIPIGLRLGAAAIAPRPVSASLVVLTLGFGIAGAICGVGTLALARRADTRDSQTKLRPSQTRTLISASSSLAKIGRRTKDLARLWFRFSDESRTTAYAKRVFAVV